MTRSANARFSGSTRRRCAAPWAGRSFGRWGGGSRATRRSPTRMRATPTCRAYWATSRGSSRQRLLHQRRSWRFRGNIPRAFRRCDFRRRLAYNRVGQSPAHQGERNQHLQDFESDFRRGADHPWRRKSAAHFGRRAQCREFLGDDPLARKRTDQELSDRFDYDRQWEFDTNGRWSVCLERISIEDTMNVMVRYRDGALLNYTLNAFSPREGFRVTFTGDRGRLEYRGGPRRAPRRRRGPHDSRERARPRRRPPPPRPAALQARLRRSGAGGRGRHGGGDVLLQEQIFATNPPADPFGRSAGHEQGAASILVGIAGNESMATGREIAINDLVTLRPDARRLSELV